MRDLGIPDLDSDGGQPFSDVADPVVTAHRGEGLGDRFVERLRRHVERMRGVVQIVDNDGAGFKEPRWQFIIFAICSPMKALLISGGRDPSGKAELDLRCLIVYLMLCMVTIVYLNYEGDEPC